MRILEVVKLVQYVDPYYSERRVTGRGKKKKSRAEEPNKNDGTTYNDSSGKQLASVIKEVSNNGVLPKKLCKLRY